MIHLLKFYNFVLRKFWVIFSYSPYILVKLKISPHNLSTFKIRKCIYFCILLLWILLLPFTSSLPDIYFAFMSFYSAYQNVLPSYVWVSHFYCPNYHCCNNNRENTQDWSQYVHYFSPSKALPLQSKSCKLPNSFVMTFP